MTMDGADLVTETAATAGLVSALASTLASTWGVCRGSREVAGRWVKAAGVSTDYSMCLGVAETSQEGWWVGYRSMQLCSIQPVAC
jgi:hypothetical protein